MEKESTLIPSVLYTSRSQIAIEEIDEDKLRKRVAAAKTEQTKKEKIAIQEKRPIKIFSDKELENRERGIMRRELAEHSMKIYQGQEISEALYSDSEVLFGETAVKRHINDPKEGYFIKSPKSFIGADLQRKQLDLFSEIITRMLANIKNIAEKQVNAVIDQIVLGKPVNFHGTLGEKGNRQAIKILEKSAVSAGFNYIEFLYEPIAAALDYERQLEKDKIVLVLEAGGGTTDCSVVKVGPSYQKLTNRDETILGYAGERLGGMDIDIKLAMKKIMPSFGSESYLNDGLPMPNSHFWNAVSINDVNAQSKFYSEATGRELNRLLAQATEKSQFERLLKLHRQRYSYRLNRSAELAKIHLSDRELIKLPLNYTDRGLMIEISRQDLRDAIDMELNKLISLMKEVERQSQKKPDVIYVTGGMAKSPILREYLSSNFIKSEIVIGDLFGSITAGLATWAYRIFQ